MMKFIVLLIFMNFMLWVGNNFLFMYYNLLYFTSLMVLSAYMFKSYLCIMISMGMGMNYYSFWLIILSIWIVGLMFNSLELFDGSKMIMFIFMLSILINFFLGMDLMVFYLMFEVSLIPTFFLIVYWGSNYERVTAAYYLIVYMLLISFPLLLYIMKLHSFTMTFSFMLMFHYVDYFSVGFWGFMVLYMSFFIKLPMYIVHVWLPKAHVEAPVYGSMILAGVLLKMGGYGVIRLSEIFYKIVLEYNFFIMSVGIVGAMVTSMLTLVQVDMKSLVAYSSVVHMNLMLSGLMTLSKSGILGAYIMMVSHGLCSSGMFYMVNMFYSRTNSRLVIINKGLISKMPIVCFWWFLFCVMNFSYPFSLNFISEVMILLVILNWDLILMGFLMIICFYSSAYSLYLFSYVSHGSMMINSIDGIMSSYLKEYLVIILHFFPLLYLLFNLVMFN